MFVPRKSSEVVARKIDGCFPRADKSGFGTIRAQYDRYRIEVGLFLSIERLPKRFGSPFIYELVDFL